MKSKGCWDCPELIAIRSCGSCDSYMTLVLLQTTVTEIETIGTRYWVIGYWVIFAGIALYCYWVIFFRCDTQCDTDQTVVSTVCMFNKHNHLHLHRVLRFYVV